MSIANVAEEQWGHVVPGRLRLMSALVEKVLRAHPPRVEHAARHHSAGLLSQTGRSGRVGRTRSVSGFCRCAGWRRQPQKSLSLPASGAL